MLLSTTGNYPRPNISAAEMRTLVVQMKMPGSRGVAGIMLLVSGEDRAGRT